MRQLVFFNLPNPSSRNIALGFSEHLTEMTTKNLPAGKEGPPHKTNNLTAISEPNV
jgi:hypothetical protein